MTKILEYSMAGRSLTLRNIDKSGFSIIAKEDIHVDEGDIKKIGNLFESVGIPFRSVNDLNGTPRPEIITLELFKDEADKILKESACPPTIRVESASIGRCTRCRRKGATALQERGNKK